MAQQVSFNINLKVNGEDKVRYVTMDFSVAMAIVNITAGYDSVRTTKIARSLRAWPMPYRGRRYMRGQRPTVQWQT